MSPTRRALGVGMVGVGWVATQHLAAFLKNPHARVVALCSRNERRARERLEAAGVEWPSGAGFTTRYADLLESPDIDIISISTPNHLHATQAVAAAKAGKHILLEKPTALDLKELRAVGTAVQRAGVRTIVSFELHYNPYLRFARWLRESGWLGNLRFARFQYLSRVTDWYSGWNWARTKRSGRSHLLAAGCHAVDALRWCTGLEATEVSACHTRFTAGYEYPTSIAVNLTLGASQRSPVLAQLLSSTDFQMPYAFDVELMGDRATLRNDLVLWNEQLIELDELRRACPIPGVTMHAGRTATGADAIRVVAEMPGSADVTHHPFQGEIDELVDCIVNQRDTHLNVHDARKTMEICLAADRSAERGGSPVRLPLIRQRT